MYLRKEQRSQPGCSGRRMQADFHLGLLGSHRTGRPATVRPAGLSASPQHLVGLLEPVHDALNPCCVRPRQGQMGGEIALAARYLNRGPMNVELNPVLAIDEDGNGS